MLNLKVAAYCVYTGKILKIFNSKAEAARFYKVTLKTVYNHCYQKTKTPRRSNDVRFQILEEKNGVMGAPTESYRAF